VHISAGATLAARGARDTKKTVRQDGDKTRRWLNSLFIGGGNRSTWNH